MINRFIIISSLLLSPLQSILSKAPYYCYQIGPSLLTWLPIDHIQVVGLDVTRTISFIRLQMAELNRLKSGVTIKILMLLDL